MSPRQASVIRILLGVVLAVAAFEKIRHPPEVGNLLSDLAPPGSTRLMAFLLLELGLAVWLLLGVAIQWAPLAFVAFLSVLTGVVTVELGRDVPRYCGCFATTHDADSDPDEVRQSLQLTIGRNVLLLIGGSLVFLHRRDSHLASKHPHGSRGKSTTAWMPCRETIDSHQSSCPRTNAGEEENATEVRLHRN